MKKALLRIVPVCLLSLALAGCSGYMKLQRTGTNQEKYSAAMHYLNAGKNQKVIDLLGAVRPAYVGKSQQDSIDYFTALAYYRLGDYETSGALFDQFRKSYGNGRSVFMEDAEFLYADGLYRSSPPPNRDQNETILAIMAADEYLGHYPNSEYRPYMLDNMEELQDKLKEKSYINAKLYYTTGEYKSAVVALRNSLEQYPDTKHREEILYLIVRSNWELARNSLESLQRERYMSVMESYYNYVGEYPEGNYAGEIEKMHGEAQEYIAQFSEKEKENTNTSDTQDGN